MLWDTQKSVGKIQQRMMMIYRGPSLRLPATKLIWTQPKVKVRDLNKYDCKSEIRNTMYFYIGLKASIAL